MRIADIIEKSVKWRRKNREQREEVRDYPVSLREQEEKIHGRRRTSKVASFTNSYGRK